MALTPDEYRALHQTALEDAALQMLLDAALADIVAFTGTADDTIVEWFTGGRAMLALTRPASSITSIVEVSWYDGSETTLAVDDYLLDPTGYLLYRQRTGTNPRSAWWGRVVVTYEGRDTAALRDAVQADLVHLAETYTPGVGLEVVGAWTQQYVQAMDANSRIRADILSRLTTRGRMVVV